MKIFFIQFLILSFFVGALTTSCSSSDRGTEEHSDIFKESYQQINDIELRISNKQILGKADNRNSIRIKKLLGDLMSSLKYIEKNPGDSNQVLRALGINQQISQLNLPLSDKLQFEPLVSRTGQILAQISSERNIDISRFNWSLYTYDFGAGTYPFVTYANSAKWNTDWNVISNQTYATTKQGSQRGGNSSWLVSPKFDFKQIKNPSLVLRHSININEASKPFNSQDIKDRIYKVKVSTNYADGEPSNADWEEIDIKVPQHFGFHTMTTSSPLEKYAGLDNVSIALHFDQSSEAINEVGFHFMLWTVFQFSIVGSGSLPAPALPILPAFVYNFDDKTFGPFLPSTTNPDSNEWRISEFRGNKFATLNTDREGRANTGNLVAPNLKLKKINPNNKLALVISYTVKAGKDTYSIWDRLKLKVSSSYNDSLPIPSNDWTEVPYNNRPELQVDKFTKLTSQPIDLSGFDPSNLTLNFEFIAEAGDNHLWQISNIEIIEIK